MTEYLGHERRGVEDLGDPSDPVGHEVENLALVRRRGREFEDDQDVPVAREEVELLDLGESLEEAPDAVEVPALDLEVGERSDALQLGRHHRRQVLLGELLGPDQTVAGGRDEDRELLDAAQVLRDQAFQAAGLADVDHVDPIAPVGGDLLGGRGAAGLVVGKEEDRGVGRRGRLAHVARGTAHGRLPHGRNARRGAVERRDDLLGLNVERQLARIIGHGFPRWSGAGYLMRFARGGKGRKGFRRWAGWEAQ